MDEGKVYHLLIQDISAHDMNATVGARVIDSDSWEEYKTFLKMNEQQLFPYTVKTLHGDVRFETLKDYLDTIGIANVELKTYRMLRKEQALQPLFSSFLWVE